MKPKPGQEVSIRYTEAVVKKNSKGEVIEPSRVLRGNKSNNGNLFTFQVGENDVIVAWDMCLPLMSVGETAIIRCHSDFGYGQTGW